MDKTSGGGPISRGHLYKILSNPIYLGRLTHKAQAHDGLHDPIIDQETWVRVRALLAEHAKHGPGPRQHSDALMAGRRGLDLPRSFFIGSVKPNLHWQASP